jgi:hypothetical protein
VGGCDEHCERTGWACLVPFQVKSEPEEQGDNLDY